MPNFADGSCLERIERTVWERSLGHRLLKISFDCDSMVGCLLPNLVLSNAYHLRDKCTGGGIVVNIDKPMAVYWTSTF